MTDFEALVEEVKHVLRTRPLNFSADWSVTDLATEIVEVFFEGERDDEG